MAGKLLVRERAATREAALRLRLARQARLRRTHLAEGSHWRDVRRPEQAAPEGEWFGWLILAGRGWGKTRTGAEWVIEMAELYPGCRIALIGETFGDVRDTMFEGESGILSIVDPSVLLFGSRDRAYNRTLAELRFANGSYVKGYSSERPDQLRGPAHHFAWGDEPAKWKDAPSGTRQDTTHTNLAFGLRAMARQGWPDDYTPRYVYTTTPKPVALLRSRNPEAPGLLQDDAVRVTRGSTSENLDNLAPSFVRNVIEPLVGTRLGRQELDAQLLDDTPGALWKWADIEDHRISELDLLGRDRRQSINLTRIAVAIDPSGGDGLGNDEVGIVAFGIAFPEQRVTDDGRLELGRPHGYVLADRSGKYTPAGWAAEAVSLYRELSADVVAAEVNYGGAMVKATIHSVAPNLYVHEVTASRGKAIRAQPQSSRYEQGTIHHVGVFPELEEELTSWVPGNASPNRLDALVWAMAELLGDGAETPFVF